MDVLQELLNAYTNAPEGTNPSEAVAALLAEHAGDEGWELSTVTDLIKESVPADDAPITEESVAAMEALAEVSDVVVAEIARADQADSEREGRAAELRRRLSGETEDGEGDDEDGEGTEGEGAEGTEGEGEPAEGEPAEGEGAENQPEAVAAGGNRATRRRTDQINLGAIRKANKAAAKRPGSTPGVSITASAGVPDFEPGQRLTIPSLVAAAQKKLDTFPTSPVDGLFLRHNIAKITTEFPKELVASAADSDLNVIDFAASQKRLKGGLVAAGGWCSPSETMYDLAGELEDGNAGLINVPDVDIVRGGLRFTEGPDFAALYTGTGFTQTETQAIAGTEKPFYRVPCTTFTDVRADVIGLGIISGILNNDAYPELTERVVRGALAAHNHRYNQATISRMEALSVAVTVNVGPSAATSLLNGVELQIVDLRYRYRAPETLLFEVKLPIWSKAQIRSDLALRSGVDFVHVSDQQIVQFFADRGAKVDFVYDWQDSFANATPNAGFGGANPITAWPTTVKALIYPAGTFVRGRGNVITLDGIYDSVNIKTNDFVRLFTEEKIMVVRRQYTSRVATFNIPTNGITGAPVLLGPQGLPVAA